MFKCCQASASDDSQIVSSTKKEKRLEGPRLIEETKSITAAAAADPKAALIKPAENNEHS